MIFLNIAAIFGSGILVGHGGATNNGIVAFVGILIGLLISVKTIPESD